MDNNVTQAALWLALQEPSEIKPLIPTLMKRFNLTASKATQAVTEANTIKRGG